MLACVRRTPPFRRPCRRKAPAVTQQAAFPAFVAQRELQSSRDLALYLHLPFCDHKCAYCDFNSYAGLDHLMPAYVDALVQDIALWREAVRGWTVRTVFFGGGTPSLTPLPLLGRILEGLAANFVVAADAEISLEANPGTVDE